ncbi:FCD domain-containing protein [Arthrobacter sp. zg-Y916]|nr:MULTISPECIES: FCD domain-containing protein [Arthrobacter]MCC9193792.1 FCD domain-containing protein [Arthrobacter sp. zg-Y916]USQ56129.1 FCD domain-containing protein [Arthrobacter caoxuetaonis]
MMTFIAEQVRETRLASLGQPGRPEASPASHPAIADAITAGDPPAAAAAMQAHIDLVAETDL